MHLGHVAKSFGLKESPKTIRVNDDTIGKIFNGRLTLTIFMMHTPILLHYFYTRSLISFPLIHSYYMLTDAYLTITLFIDRFYGLLFVSVGMFSAVTASTRPLLDKDAKKKARDERFSLSKTSKGTGASSGKKTGASLGKKIGSSSTSKNSTAAGGISRGSSGSRSSGGSSGSSSNNTTTNVHPNPVSSTSVGGMGVHSDRRKMRLIDGKTPLAPSGKFRKTDGYFKKKSSLRPREGKSSRVNSEFSA